MSTRSYVGRINEDGSVDAIYVHMDGYTTGNGIELYKNFQDPQKVDALIEGGARSSLHSKPYGDTPAEHFADVGACLKELSSEDCFDIQYAYFYDRSNPKEVRWSVSGLRPDDCYGKPWKKPLDLPSAVVRESSAYASKYLNDPDYGKYARGYAKTAEEWKHEAYVAQQVQKMLDHNYACRRVRNKIAVNAQIARIRGRH